MDNFFQQKVMNTVGPTINNLWQIIEKQQNCISTQIFKENNKINDTVAVTGGGSLGGIC